MIELAVAALVFVGIHLVPSSPARGWVVGRFGDAAYLAGFSIISTVTLIWLILAFADAPVDPPLWYPASAWVWVQAVLMLLASALVTGGLGVPNPSSVGQRAAVERADIAAGIFAVTRHPVMWGIGIWGITHMISQPNLRGLLFFGAITFVALVGSRRQEGRKAREFTDAWARWKAKTSYFPFAAIIAGRNRLNLRAIGYHLLVAGVMLWLGLLLGHRWLFGASVLPYLGF
ncbi:MAG: NnrU family protein [Dichotomicrobium sp.]